MNVVEKHISEFNKLNGKVVSPSTLRALHSRVKAAGKDKLKSLEVRLKNAIDKMNGETVRLQFPVMEVPKEIIKHKVVKPSTPKRATKRPQPPVERAKVISQAKAKVSKKIVEKKKVAEKKEPVTSSTVSKSNRPAGVYGVNDLANRKVRHIELDGRYKDDFHRLNGDTQILIWGVPGGGKTSYLLYLSEYFAIKKNLKVLYVAHEEISRSTFTQKMNELKITDHHNLDFMEFLPTDVKAYDVIVLDSVQSLGLNLEAYVKFAKANAGKILIPVVQCTKDGDFKGGKEWEHEVDVAGVIKNRRLLLRKNRNDPDFYEKYEELMTGDLIEDKKKARKINQTVKDQMRVSVEPVGNVTIL